MRVFVFLSARASGCIFVVAALTRSSLPFSMSAFGTRGGELPVLT